MSACDVCGKCPCYSHPRKTVFAADMRDRIAQAGIAREQRLVARIAELEMQLLEARAALATAEARAVTR